MTANLGLGRVDVAATASMGAGTNAMHHSTAATGLPVIVHGCSTALRIRTKQAQTSHSVAAHEIDTAEHGIATAQGVRTIGLLYDVLIAAEVRLVVIDLGTTATGAPAVPADLQGTLAADVASIVVG